MKKHTKKTAKEFAVSFEMANFAHRNGLKRN